MASTTFMSKLSQMFHRPYGTTFTSIGLLDARVMTLLNRSQAVGLKPQAAATIAGLLFIGLISWINYGAVRGLNFEYIYLFGCSVVGWIAGARSAVICTVASSIPLFLSDLQTANGRSLWLTITNSLVRLLAFVSISWLAAELGKATRDLERAINQRTMRLQQELKEHKQTAGMLTEAMEMFKQVTENIADVFWVTDPTKSQVEYVSPEFEQLWGRACQSLYVSPSVWFEGIHQEDRERVTRATLSKQVNGEYNEEYRVVRPDGSLRWVHDRAFPVRDSLGEVYRLVGIAEDITERKRTESLLLAERDVGIALSSTSDLKYALERLLDVAVQLDGIDCGGVYLVDGETGELHLQAHRGLSGSFVARILRYDPASAEARLAHRGKAVYMRQDQIPRTLEVLWGSEGLRALAVVPVQHHGIVLGVLNLASYRQDEIYPRTRVGIEMIASQVAGAIARIRAEESLRQSETHLRTIVNSAPIALVATDAKGVITLEDGQALKAMGARPGEHLRQRAEEVYRDFPLIQENIRRGLAGETFSSFLEFDSTVFECRYTPVRTHQQLPGGLIAVATDVTERFRLQREILEISDREQARIGQDIHDGLCQQLIGLAICANSLEQKLAAAERVEAELAQKISRLLDESITEARGVCQGLYPIRLSTQGLPPALEELAAATAERHGIECVCEVGEAGLHCDMPTATHLYRIAQEAINNAVKYSGARHLWIRLQSSAEGLTLEVKDDGKWVAPKTTRHSGMGMHIMDYRAQLIGGSFRCEGDQQGTTACCRIPRLGSTNSL
jgi:PAS domain S-box-containing protein